VLTSTKQTYNSHFDFNDTHVLIRPSVLQTVRQAGIAAALTFEFYPRVERANAVNFTVNVERTRG
jgi:hypothetical protein